MTYSPPEADHALVRFALTRECLRTRLSLVSRVMSAANFSELVDRMASLQMEYEDRRDDVVRTIDRRVRHRDRRTDAPSSPAVAGRRQDGERAGDDGS